MEVGTGTEMIVEKCKEYGLSAPDFEQNEFFKLTFWRNAVDTEENNNLGGQIGGQMLLSETQQKIIKYIESNPQISRKELSMLLNINVSAVQKHIDKLKKEGVIYREGADRGGYWIIIGR